MVDILATTFLYKAVTDGISDNSSETISIVTTRNKGTAGKWMTVGEYQCKLSLEMAWRALGLVFIRILEVPVTVSILGLETAYSYMVSIALFSPPCK
jgi:hypothetical protein